MIAISDAEVTAVALVTVAAVTLLGNVVVARIAKTTQSQLREAKNIAADTKEIAEKHAGEVTKALKDPNGSTLGRSVAKLDEKGDKVLERLDQLDRQVQADTILDRLDKLGRALDDHVEAALPLKEWVESQMRQKEDPHESADAESP
jgi:hypothetical protein